MSVSVAETLRTGTFHPIITLVVNRSDNTAIIFISPHMRLAHDAATYIYILAFF